MNSKLTWDNKEAQIEERNEGGDKDMAEAETN